MKALRRTLIIAAVLLAFGLVGILGGYFFYRSSHVKVCGTVYAKDTAAVDLRGQEASVEDVKALRMALPNAVVTWDIPFQNQRLPDDTQEITVTSLTMEDLDTLNYLPKLTHVDALECRDYEALLALEEQRPNCQVDFQIHLGDQALPRDTRKLTIKDGDPATAEELGAALQYLPQLTEVFLENPSIPAKDLYTMQEQHPNVSFDWSKKILNKVYATDLEELDLQGEEKEILVRIRKAKSKYKPAEPEIHVKEKIIAKNLGSIQEFEDTLAYFPNLKKVYLENVDYTNDELAGLRERARGKYLVVWTVFVGEGHIRTDDIGFIPSDNGWYVSNEDTENLKYCEGLLAVDFGHTNIGNLEWVKGTPHLKYLIIGDGNVFNDDIKHLSCLKELEFLEIFMSPVTDVTPLQECTALRDLLLSNSYVKVETMFGLDFLDNLWLSGSGIDYKEKEQLEEHLPNTYIMTAGHGGHGQGWRNLPRYFEMRDALGMWYMGG